MELMKTSSDYMEYLETNKEDITSDHMRLDRALAALIVEKKVKKADVIARSGIEPHYAYQIFSGMKLPTRDKVLMLCFGFSLSPEEAERLLKLTGYAQLYSKDLRDNALLFGLTKKMNVIDMNSILYDLELELLQ